MFSRPHTVQSIQFTLTAKCTISVNFHHIACVMCFISVFTSSKLTRPYIYVIYILMYIQPCMYVIIFNKYKTVDVLKCFLLFYSYTCLVSCSFALYAFKYILCVNKEFSLFLWQRQQKHFLLSSVMLVVLLPSKYCLQRSDVTRHSGVPWVLHNWRQAGGTTQWISEWSTVMFQDSLKSRNSSPFIKYHGWCTCL